jgi:hypothetical protein
MTSRVVFGSPQPGVMREAGYVGVDMHFHSDRSADSLARINLTLRKARSAGIGVAFTDHNEVSAAVEFFRNKERVMVVPGIEVTCREGVHTALYFYTAGELREFSRKVLAPLKVVDPFRLPMSTAEMMETAKGYGAVVCAPHAFGPGQIGLHSIKVTREMERLVDVVEGINAYCLHGMNVRALRWAERLGKPLSAGSDGHIVAELGQALTFAKAHDVSSFLDAVRRGRTTVWGAENRLFEKAVVGYEKEKSFLQHAHKHKEGWRLLHDQLGAECEHIWSSLKRHFKRHRHRYSDHFRAEHPRR